MSAGIIVAFLIKASAPGLPWGINAREGTVQPTAPALSAYCAQSRGNPLIILDLADDLYASVLPLPRLRYAALVSVAAPTGPYAMPFPEMGVNVTVDQFNHLARYEPGFRSRLREWGLPPDASNAAPLATVITARSPEELTALVMAHPDTDFLISDAYQDAVRSVPQEHVAATADHFFLLSRIPLQRPSPAAWTCRM
jgi:hypothetical protein